VVTQASACRIAGFSPQVWFIIFGSPLKKTAPFKG
jgi:hypothetical protein